MLAVKKFIYQLHEYGAKATFRKTLGIIFSNPTRILAFLVPRGGLWDEVYAISMFYSIHKRRPSKPNQFFNDYLCSLKFNGQLQDPLRIFVTDKEYAKLFVIATIGKDYVIPTIAVLSSIDEIEKFDFPNRCVVKATHGSGQIIIRKNGEAIDLQRIIRWLSYNHYLASGEINYKTLVPKIIVEPLVFDSESIDDYKVFCFRGKPKFIKVNTDRGSNMKVNIFDCQWKQVDYGLEYPRNSREIPRPSNLEEMLRISEILSGYFESMRVDLYSNGRELFVGELTNCHASASERFFPEFAEADFSKIYFN